MLMEFRIKNEKFPSTAKYQLEIECSASVETKMLNIVVVVVKNMVWL